MIADPSMCAPDLPVAASPRWRGPAWAGIAGTVLVAGAFVWTPADLALDVLVPVAVLVYFWPSLFPPRGMPVQTPVHTGSLFAPSPAMHMVAMDPNAPSLMSDGDILATPWERMAYYHVLALGQAAHPVPSVPTDVPTAAPETLSVGARLACEVVLTKIPARLAYEQDQFAYLTIAYLLRHYNARALGELEFRAKAGATTLEQLQTAVQSWLSGYFFAPNEAKREIRMLQLPTIPPATTPHPSAQV